MTAQYYRTSGEVHVNTLGALVLNVQEVWPVPVGLSSCASLTEAGRSYCDFNGIPRDGDWVKIGNVSARDSIAYKNLHYYYLEGR
jgi:hypothetical protein